MDIVAKRHQIASLLSIAGKLPFVMSLYSFYWRIRIHLSQYTVTSIGLIIKRPIQK